ncbi:hypothetical protein AC249_AIPGENE3264 [Exaiptasia diaphana]|nr:hypothetical protein AC249_AIPGENE3264 [Exaiptasia diaphana]
MLQQQRTSLPRPQVPKFNGNPLEYHNFLRAFDTLIASKEPDYSCKLYYLEQYTVGRPQELVRSCLHMKPGDGYLKARDLLEQRFGDKYKMAMAHVDKLLSIQLIKTEDADSLEKYSISLTSCKNELEGIGYPNKIENPDVMRKIVEKLPYKYHQEKWRDIADTIINVQREVTIEDIATFVEQRERSLNNPNFGTLAFSTKCKQPTSHAKTFTGLAKVPIVTESKKTCHVCNANHSVADCPVFKEKTYKERMDIAKNRLCFSCLRKGHQVASCFKKKPCSECNRRHNTLLHSDVSDRAVSTASSSVTSPTVISPSTNPTASSPFTKSSESTSSQSLAMNATKQHSVTKSADVTLCRLFISNSLR